MCISSRISFTVSASGEASSPVRLAVMNTAKDSELRHKSDIAANVFTGTLAKSKAVALAEREELDVIIQEQKITASELEDSAAKIGGIMGCQYMLLVSLVYEASPIISAKLVDVATSQVVYSDTEIPDALDESSMTAASSRMADKVLEVLAGEQAVITEINRREITINRGSSSGVRKGDLYRVYTGTKRSTVNLAVIRVKDVHSSFSYAEVIKNGGSLSSIRRSDNVEAVSKKEADSLIKGKKIAKKRSGEKAASTKARTSQEMTRKAKGGAEGDFEKFIKATQDYYVEMTKREENISRSNNKEMYNNMGDSWVDFGKNIVQYANEEMKKLLDEEQRLATINAGRARASKEQKKLQETMQEGSRTIDKLVKDCYASAIRCFGWSAQRGDAYAQNELGLIYLKGVGVEKDYSKAFEMFSKAAAQGRNNAEQNLAAMYFNGWGVRQDNAKALEFLHKAADHGNDMSQADLGHAYLSGIIVKQDYTKAAEYLHPAAEKGNGNAQNDLGFMYFNGLGMRQDYTKAAELFRQSAERGNSNGQFNLGYMYSRGLGLPQDIRQAIELFRKAAAQGHEGAKNELQAFGLSY